MGAGFGLAFSVLLAISLLQCATTKQLVEAGGWMVRTDEALTAMRAVLSDVKDAEIWLRGYTATCDQMFLEPCRAEMTRSPKKPPKRGEK